MELELDRKKKELNSNHLEEISEMVGDLRHDLLFSFDEAGMEAVAEQHFLAAISFLEQAQIQVKLAHIHQMRATI